MDNNINEDRALATREGQIINREVDAPLSIVQVLEQLELVKKVQINVMKDGMHYGTIPGTKKPTLYQPGAQTLLLTFRLAPSYTITRSDLPNYHREYTVKCALKTITGGVYVGEGVGSASTMESKYRWHKDNSSAWEATEHSVPKSYWTLKDSAAKSKMLRQICDDEQASFGTKKLDEQGNEVGKGKPGGEWRIVKFSNDEKEQDRKENPNIADTWNTILKMAAKRALVCATLNVTAASDVFTQDLEDLGAMLEHEDGEQVTYVETPAKKEPVADNPSPPKKTPTRGANAQETASQQGDELPMGDTPRGEYVETPEKTLKGWRDCVVHVKSTIQNKKLGDLSAAHLETIKAMWFPTVDWMGDNPKLKAPAAQDWTLKACVMRGLKDLASGAPNEEPPPAKKAPVEQSPVTGKSEPSEREKLQTQLKTLCEDNIITESTLAEKLREFDGFPDDMTQITDPRVTDDALQELIGQFDALMLAWGFKSKPVEKKPRKKLGK